MNTLQIIQKVFGNNDVSEKWLEKQYEFAEIVAVAEREACADLVLTLTCMGNAKECFETAAAYIRARRNT